MREFDQHAPSSCLLFIQKTKRSSCIREIILNIEKIFIARIIRRIIFSFYFQLPLVPCFHLWWFCLVANEWTNVFKTSKSVLLDFFYPSVSTLQCFFVQFRKPNPRFFIITFVYIVEYVSGSCKGWPESCADDPSILDHVQIAQLRVTSSLSIKKDRFWVLSTPWGIYESFRW